MRTTACIMLMLQAIVGTPYTLDLSGNPEVVENGGMYRGPAVEGAPHGTARTIPLNLTLTSIQRVAGTAADVEVVVALRNDSPAPLEVPLKHRECRAAERDKGVQLLLWAASGKHLIAIASDTCVVSPESIAVLRQGESLSVRVHGRVSSLLAGVPRKEIDTHGVVMSFRTMSGAKVTGAGSVQLVPPSRPE